ncbi:ribose-5-phosphate isomerase RpiA [Paenibacillus soyae]|uniref:Ribose-5-phosphate isomerase A n=1 Tax=Paenibacillus soyae TaxID=2969249 RepID=A0A9X2S7D3_9BACL|nr:ribose-5-phosphate isomerase RpiA [Paenibacillus soyae]MCR2802926.1 ribose-5-phosphate isomerase RpiA [Paenibacillus soyae]
MNEKQLAGEKAAEFVKNGMTVGLGTGSTVYYTIRRIGEMVKEGLTIKAVSTSSSTTRLAESLRIPLVSIDEAGKLDLTIDGADEVDPAFRGIKGGGGALFFEKIVAAASERSIWVVGSDKLVDRLGRFPLPVEVVPFGYSQVYRRLFDKGLNPKLRMSGENRYITDSGNYIIDLQLGAIGDPEALNDWLNGITGVVEHGLFLGMANAVVVARQDIVEVKERENG